jgi:hypothetical protein
MKDVETLQIIQKRTNLISLRISSARYSVRLTYCYLDGNIADDITILQLSFNDRKGAIILASKKSLPFHRNLDPTHCCLSVPK